MGDKDLRQSVIDELDFDPSFDAADIGVAAEAGVITLTGHVRSFAEKLAVERAVKRVRGVYGIAEEIEVRYPADKKTADDQIADRAISSINWNAQIPVDAVAGESREGLGNAHRHRRLAVPTDGRCVRCSQTFGGRGRLEPNCGQAAGPARGGQGQDPKCP